MKKTSLLLLFLLSILTEIYADRKIIRFYFFYSSECPECYRIKNMFLPELEEKYNVKFEYKIFDIVEDPKNFELLLKVRDYYNKNEANVPVLIINDNYISGFNNVIKEFPSVIEKILANDIQTEFLDLKKIEKKTFKIETLSILPILYAGLLDGINPCAFATIIFLISYLSYLKRTKKIIFLTGVFYTFSVFLAYFLIGLGIFEGLTRIPFYHKISIIINLGIATFTYILAILSLKDFILAKKGKFKEMVLQLPDSFKVKIHQKIKAYTGDKLIIFSAIILGISVSLFELACTGQIYLPTIIYLLKQQKRIAILYLLFYNTAFILPLVLVFGVFYFGIASNKIANFAQKNVPLVKFLTFILFVLLGTLLLLQAIKIV